MALKQFPSIFPNFDVKLPILQVTTVSVKEICISFANLSTIFSNKAVYSRSRGAQQPGTIPHALTRDVLRICFRVFEFRSYLPITAIFLNTPHESRN